MQRAVKDLELLAEEQSTAEGEVGNLDAALREARATLALLSSQEVDRARQGDDEKAWVFSGSVFVKFGREETKAMLRKGNASLCNVCAPLSTPSLFIIRLYLIFLNANRCTEARVRARGQAEAP